MRSWESLAARIDALTLRERGFVMAGVLAVTYFLWVGMIAQPMEKRQRDMNTNLERIAAEIAGLNAQSLALIQQAKDDPNAIHRAELESLKAELAQLNKDLAGTTDHLVPPEQMAKVLEAMLRGTDGLQLQQVTSLGNSPLVPGKKKPAVNATAADADAQDSGESVRSVHKHGVRLKLQGSFFSVLDFLRKLEQLEWKFFWDAVEFRVVDYPDATVEITVYTISMEPTWIGA